MGFYTFMIQLEGTWDPQLHGKLRLRSQDPGTYIYLKKRLEFSVSRCRAIPLTNTLFIYLYSLFISRELPLRCELRYGVLLKVYFRIIDYLFGVLGFV